jgi:serine/alanine adding enzyme
VRSDNINVLAAGCGQWAQWLERVSHDFYHTEAYHLFSERNGEGLAYLIVYGAKDRFVAWPFLLRRIDGGKGLLGDNLMDVAAVYGYTGPLIKGCGPGDPFLDAAWAAFCRTWRKLHVVSVFTCFHPLLENHRWCTRFCREPGSASDDPEPLHYYGQSVSIDLMLPSEENWRNYSKVLRQEIQSARRRGLVFEIEHSWHRLKDFLQLYHGTMERNHASPRYFFSADYLWQLRSALREHLYLSLVRLDEQVAAAMLVVEYRGVVQAHLAGTDPAFLAVSPLKLLLDEVHLWARKRNNTTFHLGAGRSGQEDALFAFKSRFSPRRHPFVTGRWILDRGAYLRLVEERKKYAAELGKTVLDTNYFPGYRAPLADTARREPVSFVLGQESRPQRR